MRVPGCITAIVIDDNEDICDVFSEFLEIIGVVVLGAARNGKDGFELFEKARPDIVFLDWMMPEFDGKYALDRIHQTETNSFITILVSEDPADIMHKLERQPDKIIKKPFEVDEIRKIIEQVRSGGGPRQYSCSTPPA